MLNSTKELFSKIEIEKILNQYAKQYDTIDFIKNDPSKFIHKYKNKKDIEIAGFIASLFAYGKRELFLQQLEKFLTNIRKTNLLKTAIAPNKGGIFGAIFKGLVKNNLGFKFENTKLTNSEPFLFGETETRYIIGTQTPELMEKILNLHKIPFTKLGKTTCDNIQLGELEIDKTKAFEAYQNAFK